MGTDIVLLLEPYPSLYLVSFMIGSFLSALHLEPFFVK